MNQSHGRIRAITLDVGGTLIQPWPSVGHVYARVAAEFGLPGLPPQWLNDQFKCAWAARGAFDYTRPAWHRLVNRTFAGVIQQPVATECFDRIYQQFAQAESWQTFADVVPTLKHLRDRRIRLGVISNWDERLEPLLERLDLARWFEAIVVSHQLNCVKPAPAIFRHAAERLGCDPEEILHVGDSAEDDVAGARAAGFQAARIDRSDPGSSKETVSDLSALVGLLPLPSTGRGTG
jgi:putative hydrolase of the HAD superfamily